MVPSGKQPFQPRYAYFDDGRPRYQADFLTDADHRRARPVGDRRDAGLRRRQGGRQDPGLRDRPEDPPVRPPDRLGLVLFHHQADVLPDRLALQAARQFRPRHPRHHRHRQGHLLPARQQVLHVDGEHEEGAAEDAGDPREIRGRQDEAAAGDDGALQDREDQSDRRLLADADPDPGLLRALQGALRHHRDAPRAVLRLDPGSRRARSDLDLQPVRPAALRGARSS